MTDDKALEKLTAELRAIAANLYRMQMDYYADRVQAAADMLELLIANVNLWPDVFEEFNAIAAKALEPK